MISVAVSHPPLVVFITCCWEMLKSVDQSERNHKILTFKEPTSQTGDGSHSGTLKL